MPSLAGSVPGPCEQRTYTRKQSPNILIQWGWELSQQWSSGKFRQVRVCNQKGQKGSTGRQRTCFSPAGRRKAQLTVVFSKGQGPGARPFARLRLWGLIGQVSCWYYVNNCNYTYSMSCARPCALLHDPPLDWPWTNLGALLGQPQKSTGLQRLPLPVSMQEPS